MSHITMSVATTFSQESDWFHTDLSCNSTLDSLRILQPLETRTTLSSTYHRLAVISAKQAIIFCLYLMWMHVLYYMEPHEQKHINRILHLLVPIAMVALTPHAKAMAVGAILFAIVGNAAWHVTLITALRRRAKKEVALRDCTLGRTVLPVNPKQKLSLAEIHVFNPKDIVERSDTTLEFNNDITVAAWRLNPFDNVLADPEACFGYHPRTQVDQRDIEPNAKYRAVCKLITYFQNGNRSEGSGWLIDNSTVVTSGHCVYSREHGCAMSTAVYVGYNGIASVRETNVECQIGECIALHYGWYTSSSAVNDLAFIRVTKPFTDVSPIPWKDCPTKGENIQIRVVGYPGDMPDGRLEEKGQHMFESAGPITFNLEHSEFMLHYKLDTEVGNSGSPVLEIGPNGKAVAIGVHRGGSVRFANTAVVIGHKGNIVLAFLKTLSLMTDHTVRS